MSYLERFKRLKDTSPELLELDGDLMIVEVVGMEIKSKSGIVLASDARQVRGSTTERVPGFYRVLYTGAGYKADNEDEKDQPVAFEPGDVVIAAKEGVVLYTGFPLIASYQSDSMGLLRARDVLGYVDGGEEGLAKLQAVLDV